MLIRLAKGVVIKVAVDSNGDGTQTLNLDDGQSLDTIRMSAVRIKLPGNVRPDFSSERKQGLTIGEVFGRLSLESLLDKSAEKIMAGCYRIKLMLSPETGVVATGVPALGEQALVAFLTACGESKDSRVRAWVSEVIKLSSDKVN